MVYGTRTVLVQRIAPELLTPQTMNRPEPVVSTWVEGHVITAASVTMYPLCEKTFTRSIPVDETAALMLPAVPLVTVMPQFTGDAPQALSAFTVAMKFSLIDAVVDRATGRLIEGDLEKPQEATEVWTFVRPTGGKPADWKLSAIQQVA